MSRAFRILAVVVACCHAGFGPGVAEAKDRLSIATGGTGGVFYPLGGGLARILSAHVPDTEVNAEVTGGSVDNLKLIADGEADLGLSTLDSATDAIQGEGAYKDMGPLPIRAILVWYDSFVHVVAAKASGIAALDGLRGKRVSLGSAGSSTEVVARRLIAAAGLNPDQDVRGDFLSVTESCGALKDGKIDAFFWIGGVPTAAITDLFRTHGDQGVFLDVTPQLHVLERDHPGLYLQSELPAETYGPSQASAVQGIGIPNVLCASASMPAAKVHTILKTIFERLDDVRAIHPEAAALSRERAHRPISVPFHPGAESFFRGDATAPSAQ